MREQAADSDPYRHPAADGYGAFSNPHSNSYADASRPATSGACRCKSYGYGSDADTRYHSYSHPNARTTDSDTHAEA